VPPNSLWRDELGEADDAEAPAASIFSPPLAQVCGVFLNAIFLDHLDSDLDHLRPPERAPRRRAGDRAPRGRR
jgi:NTE family protein